MMVRPASTARQVSPAAAMARRVPVPTVGRSNRISWSGRIIFTTTPGAPESRPRPADHFVGAFHGFHGDHRTPGHHDGLAEGEGKGDGQDPFPQLTSSRSCSEGSRPARTPSAARLSRTNPV